MWCSQDPHHRVVTHKMGDLSQVQKFSLRSEGSSPTSGSQPATGNVPPELLALKAAGLAYGKARGL